MTVTEINGVELQQLENQLGTKYQEILKQVQHLNNVINNLESQWTGIGKNAFDLKQRQINEDMRVIGKILQGFTDSIHMTRTLTGETEDDVAQRMNRLESNVDMASGQWTDSTQSSKLDNM